MTSAGIAANLPNFIINANNDKHDSSLSYGTYKTIDLDKGIIQREGDALKLTYNHADNKYTSDVTFTKTTLSDMESKFSTAVNVDYPDGTITLLPTTTTTAGVTSTTYKSLNPLTDKINIWKYDADTAKFVAYTTQSDGTAGVIDPTCPTLPGNGSGGVAYSNTVSDTFNLPGYGSNPFKVTSGTNQNLLEDLTTQKIYAQKTTDPSGNWISTDGKATIIPGYQVAAAQKSGANTILVSGRELTGVESVSASKEKLVTYYDNNGREVFQAHYSEGSNLNTATATDITDPSGNSITNIVTPDNLKAIYSYTYTLPDGTRFDPTFGDSKTVPNGYIETLPNGNQQHFVYTETANGGTLSVPSVDGSDVSKAQQNAELHSGQVEHTTTETTSGPSNLEVGSVAAISALGVLGVSGFLGSVGYWFLKKGYKESVRNTIQDETQKQINAGQIADPKAMSKEGLAQLDTHEKNFKLNAGRTLGVSAGSAVGGLVAIMVCAFATGGLALPVIAAIGVACTLGGLIAVGGPVGLLAAPALAGNQANEILKKELHNPENIGNEKRLNEVSQKTSKKVEVLMSDGVADKETMKKFSEITPRRSFMDMGQSTQVNRGTV